jgi:hypothetical protein
MSASIRFLGVAVLAWAGVRAVSLGLIPGAASLAPVAEAATTPIPPAIAETQFTPPAPPMPAGGAMAGAPYPPYAPYASYPGYPAYAPYPVYARPVAVPYYYPVPASMPRSAMRPSGPSGWSQVAPPPEPLYYGPELEEPEAGPRHASTAADARSIPPAPAAIPGPGATPIAKRFDRLELSAWALLRGSPGPGNLATGGTLGGSQVGARLMYKFTPALAATLRSSSSVGGVRYAEVAAGVRYKPVASLPIAVTFERRQALNEWGGRNAFALFAEGGLYQTPVFGLANLDLYAQGGVVGFKSRDLFFDGAATFTRPVWKNWSAGFGVWGGAQPGLYRVDAGPRVSMNVGRGIRLHADYRQRLAGEAAPSSGPALTIAGDF